MQTLPSNEQCMWCATVGNPKSVIPGMGLGVKVLKKDGSLIGYLHANCKAQWQLAHDQKGERQYTNS